jgi:hypothetical protein
MTRASHAPPAETRRVGGTASSRSIVATAFIA